MTERREGKKSDDFGTDSPKNVQKFTSDLIRTFPDDADFSALELLRKYPFLAEHRSCVLDLAYEEFCRLRENGAKVRPTEFARQFRDVEQSLHRVIEFDQIIHDHPSFVENVPETHWPVAGDLVSGFVLMERIGRGVLSRVFVATQPALGDRKVVAKICVRGEQEASLIGRLSHSSIAGVHSISRFGDYGLSVICMPYETRATLHHLAELLWVGQQDRADLNTEDVARIVHRVNSDDPKLSAEPDRQSLGNKTNAAALPFSILLADWGAELADALSHAHSHSVFHCDVKPGNVLVLPDLSVKLLDFNLATSKHLPSQIVGGTLPYMASEQLLSVVSVGKNSTDESGSQPATDVFGLCATLWHVVTGNPPFGVSVDEDDRRKAAECLLSRQRGGIPDEQILQAARIVDSRIVQILVKGLHYDPASRYATAKDLETAFREIAQILRTELDASRKTPTKISRRIAVGAVVGSVFAGTWWWVTRRDPRIEIVSQALLHIRDVEFSEARTVLRQIPPNAFTSEIRYLDLYCRMFLDIERLQEPFAPKLLPGQNPEVPRATRAECLKNFSHDWLDLKVEGLWKEAAILNAAFVLIQDTGGTDESLKILNRLTDPSVFVDHVQRVRFAGVYYDAARAIVNEPQLSEDAGSRSAAFRLLESRTAAQMTSRECRYRICVELDRWKQAPTTGSDRSALESNLRSFLDDAVGSKISMGELYRYLDRITENQFKYTSDQYSETVAEPLYMLSPDEVYEEMQTR